MGKCNAKYRLSCYMTSCQSPTARTDNISPVSYYLNFYTPQEHIHRRLKKTIIIIIVSMQYLRKHIQEQYFLVYRPPWHWLHGQAMCVQSASAHETMTSSKRWFPASQTSRSPPRRSPAASTRWRRKKTPQTSDCFWRAYVGYKNIYKRPWFVKLTTLTSLPPKKVLLFVFGKNLLKNLYYKYT